MTSIHTNQRAMAIAASALAITAITAPAVSARPSHSPHQLLHVHPAASTSAPRASAASILRRPTHDANANPHRMLIATVGISTLAREFTTAAARRGGGIVNVDKPVAPTTPSITRQPRKVGRTGLIVSDVPPPARSRHTSTHKFSNDGKDHIPAGDLHTDPAGIHGRRPVQIGHMGTHSVRGAIGDAGSALTGAAANTLSSPPAIPAPLKSGPARAAAPAAPPTPPSPTPLTRPRRQTLVVAA